MFNKRKKGVTLIELLAIIVIMGILSATAYVTYNTIFDKSELSMGHNQASAIQDAVAKYMAESGGELPLEKPNADYISHPAKIDIAKIADDLKGKPKGNFYIYGPEKKVSFDYPVEYIKKQYDSYTNKSLVVIAKESRIDTDKLLKQWLDNKTLSSKAFTNYILMGDGTVIQTLDRLETPSEGNITIIPSQSAPYTSYDLISFSAVAFSPKGDVSDYTWTPSDATNPKRYAVGSHIITVTAKDKDGNILKDEVEIEVKNAPANAGNKNPNAPVITVSPSKSTYTSDETITLTGTATDPEGDSLKIVWVGLPSGAVIGTNTASSKFPRGSNEVSAYAIDSNQNVSAKSTITLKVTNGAPIISNVDYKPKPAYQFDNISFKVSAKDMDGDLIHYEWQMDKNKDGVIASNETGLSTLDGKYPIGTHNAAVRAVDSMGMASAWKTFSFTVTNRLPTTPTFKFTGSTPAPYLSSTTPYRTTTSFNFEIDKSSVDYDGDAITYYWRIDNGAWTTTQPDGKYLIGNHTIDVKARDARGGESGVSTKTFTIVNTQPTTPAFTISSTKNTITYFDPDITTVSTDIDAGQTITYLWNLDNTGWTTTRPTQRLISGSHTLQLKARDSLGLESGIDSETFTISTAQVTYIHYFTENGTQDKSGSYTVPYGSRFTVNSVTSDYNAIASTTQSGSTLNIFARDGDWSYRDENWDPYLYSKWATKSVDQYKDNTFPSTTYWSDAYGYSANIPTSGNPTAISGYAYDSFTASQWDVNTAYADKSFPTSIPYNSNNYSGTLDDYGSPVQYDGAYTAGSTYSDWGTRSTRDCPSVSGYTTTSCTTWASYAFKSGDTCWELSGYFWNDFYKCYDWLDPDNNHLLSNYGDFTKIPIGTRVRVRTPANFSFSSYEWSATYQKYATDTRRYKQEYRGTVVRPETRTWRQNYAGTAYKGGWVYSNYKWKYTVTVKYTVY